jgi:hypothetical protein
VQFFFALILLVFTFLGSSQLIADVDANVNQYVSAGSIAQQAADAGAAQIRSSIAYGGASTEGNYAIQVATSYLPKGSLLHNSHCWEPANHPNAIACSVTLSVNDPVIFGVNFTTSVTQTALAQSANHA